MSFISPEDISLEMARPGPAEGHVTPVLRVHGPKKTTVRSALDRNAAKTHQLKVMFRSRILTVLQILHLSGLFQSS